MEGKLAALVQVKAKNRLVTLAFGPLSYPLYLIAFP